MCGGGGRNIQKNFVGRGRSPGTFENTVASVSLFSSACILDRPSCGVACVWGRLSCGAGAQMKYHLEEQHTKM